MVYDLIKISALPAATPDESQDIVVGVGDLAKRINYGDVKADMVGTSPTYTTDTEPYLMRRTAHTGVVGKCALNRLIGGSLGWNQLYPTHTSCVVTGDTTHVSATVSNGMVAITGTPTSQTTVVVRPICTVSANHVCLIMCYGYTNFAWGRTGFGYVTTDHFMNKHTADFEGTARIRLDANTAYNITNVKFGTYDLTAMFGSTIADYVYGLESATAGSGIAWLSKYIDLGTYHAYDAGSIQSVQTTAHVTTGFQQWDEQWEQGGISGEDGNNLSANDRIRSKNHIPIIGGASYYFGHIGHTGATFYVCFYDGNKTFVPPRVTYTANTIQTLPSNVKYMRFFIYDSVHSVVSYLNDITINISKTSGTPKNGDYVPYDGHSYPLDSTKEFRGIFKLDASNNLYAEGDIYYPSGVVDENYNIVDLGTLNYASETSVVTGLFRCTNTPSDMKYIGGLVCSKYIGVQRGYYANLLDGEISVTNGEELPQLRIRDVSKASLTDAQFKTAMSGIYLVYEKKTASTSTADPYQKIQTIDADGTESFTASSPVPVGHETQTPDNILAALGWLGE